MLLLGPAAQAQFKVNSPFTNNTEPGWTITGTNNAGTNDSGILTGGYGAIPVGIDDAIGSGWLRLTTNSTNQQGRALYQDGSFTSAMGVVAEFDYVSWGGSGADGLSMFLYDATQNMAGAGIGGALGYCNGAGGYLGVGLDEFGDFSGSNTGVNFCHSGSPGTTPDQVVVRGPADVPAPTGPNPLVGMAAVTDLDSPNAAARPTSRRVRMLLVPNGSGGYRVTVLLGPTGGTLSTFLDALNFPYTAPATLRLGFAASALSSTNIHEVRNALVSTPADIVVTKTVSAATVLRGQPVSYTVAVRNNDTNPTDPGDQSPPIDAANAPDITDTFPAELANATWTCTATSGSTCPAASGTGNLAITGGYTLAAAGQLTFTITGTVATTATCGGTVNNAATADFSAPDGLLDIDPSNNTASASFTVACPQLIVRKTSQTTDATGTFQFSGDNGIQAHTITTTAATVGTPVSGTTQTLLAAGTATTITEAAAANTALSNVACTGMGSGGTATATVNGSTGGSVLLDAAATNTAGPITCTFTNRAQSADLAITKSQATPNPAVPGQNVTWTITVTNNGPDPAVNVTVADAVPAAVTPVTVGGPDGASCLPTNQTVNCTFGTLAVNATRTFTVSGALAAGFAGNLANTATTTSSTPDPTLGNNSATSTTPMGAPSLNVTKSATPTSFIVAQSAAYTLTVGNSGTAPTSGAASVLDTLPAGITLASDPTTSNGWSCTANGGTTVTCTSATTLNLSPGASSAISLPVTVGAAAVPSAVNHASVGGGGDPFNGGTPPNPNTCTDSAAAPNHCAMLTTSVNTPVNTPAPTPINARWMLVLMLLAVSALAARHFSRVGPARMSRASEEALLRSEAGEAEKD